LSCPVPHSRISATTAPEAVLLRGKPIMSMPPQARTVPLRRLSGLTLATTVLIAAVAVLDFLSTWTTWNAYGLVRDYVAGTGVTESDLTAADDTIAMVARVFLAALLAAGVLFIIWLWQARLNAEQLCIAQHRRAKGWIIGSWICPVVNLWFPFMIVDDAYRASRPTNVPDLADLRSVPGNRTLGLWWTFWLTGALLDRIAVSIWDNATNVDSLQTAAITETIGSVISVGAAVTVILIIRQITTWQDSRLVNG
jgi:uncharacterized protein DUF4328